MSQLREFYQEKEEYERGKQEKIKLLKQANVTVDKFINKNHGENLLQHRYNAEKGCIFVLDEASTANVFNVVCQTISVLPDI